jgi:hypothetical protein
VRDVAGRVIQGRRRCRTRRERRPRAQVPSHPPVGLGCCRVANEANSTRRAARERTPGTGWVIASGYLT